MDGDKGLDNSHSLLDEKLRAFYHPNLKTCNLKPEL